MTDAPRPLEQVARELAAAGVHAELKGNGAVMVQGASQDSRGLQGGDLFLAWQGTAHDAHEHVGEAAARGAVAALVERFVDVPIPQLRVTEGRRAAAIVAHLLAGEPTRHLRVAAVTGTNGKTTTVQLARHLLTGLGPAAAIGTLGVTGANGLPFPGSDGLTTPGPVQLAQILEELRKGGVTTVILEASSHALHQCRMDGLSVDVAVFTNLTRDHLDYHGSLQSYLAAKAHLLDLLKEDGVVVVNGGDPAWAALPPFRGRWMLTRVSTKSDHGQSGEWEKRAGSGERLPDLVAGELDLSGEGSRFRVGWGGDDAVVSLPLLGRFNVENALAALAVALLMGMKLSDAAATLSDAPPPTGRMELTAREPVPVILDYAHTPDALRRVLETLRPLYLGRLIVVFGAGGDRDREKRPEMGRIAAEGADLAIVTSDNPRTEDPDAIVDEILAGVPAGLPAGRWERITDRRQAIARAIEVARPGDAILLAGKGHETYQIVGREKRPFDERDVVREILSGGRAA